MSSGSLDLSGRLNKFDNDALDFQSRIDLDLQTALEAEYEATWFFVTTPLQGGMGAK